MDFIKRFFRKNSRPESITASNLLAELRKIDDRLREAALLDLTKANYIKNPLVEQHVIDAKVAELINAMIQTRHGISNTIEFLQCLHNWVHTPPPAPKEPVVNVDKPLADADQEFLNKLEEAKNAR